MTKHSTRPTATGDLAIQVRPGQDHQLVIFDISQHISPRQLRLLVALALRPQEVLTYHDCHRAIYGHDQHNPSWPAVARDLVQSLRTCGLPIITIHMQGYMLQMPPDQVSVLLTPPSYPHQEDTPP